MPEQAMRSEYVLIYMNMSNFARILTVPKYTQMWANMPQIV